MSFLTNGEREKWQGCKLWHVNSVEYFDYTG